MHTASHNSQRTDTDSTELLSVLRLLTSNSSAHSLEAVIDLLHAGVHLSCDLLEEVINILPQLLPAHEQSAG